MRYPYRLKRENLHKAIEYIRLNGRDIDIALCNYYFKRANESSVLNTLTEYINNDGGFGKGLALDFLYEGSTPLSTTVGLDILRQLRIMSYNHITANALNYLVDTQCHNEGWRCINIHTNSEPRALWIEHEHEYDEIYTINPTAEIAGYFYLLGTGVYRRFANSIMDKCYSYLFKENNGNDVNDIICLMRLTRMLPDAKAAKFARMLKPRLENALCFDLSQYKTNVFTPLMVFESRYDPLYNDFANIVQDNLDFLIESQWYDGSWKVNYDWGRYEYEFSNQVPKIKANITLNNIIKLKAFDRIL